jgi:hypothetical protein
MSYTEIDLPNGYFGRIRHSDGKIAVCRPPNPEFDEDRDDVDPLAVVNSQSEAAALAEADA